MGTAVVTGATAGIGLAFVRRLARDGYDVVLVARDQARLEETAASLTGVRTETLAADLGTDDGIDAVEERVRQDDVDLLVNNAGFGHRGKFLQVPVEDELTMIKVHCEAVLELTYAALPGMAERKR